MRTALVAPCLALLAFAGCSEDDERPPLIRDAESVGFLQPADGSARSGIGAGGSASNAGTAGTSGMSGAAGSGLGGSEDMGNSDPGTPDAGNRGDAGP